MLCTRVQGDMGYYLVLSDQMAKTQKHLYHYHKGRRNQGNLNILNLNNTTQMHCMSQKEFWSMQTHNLTPANSKSEQIWTAKDSRPWRTYRFETHILFSAFFSLHMYKTGFGCAHNQSFLVYLALHCTFHVIFQFACLSVLFPKCP